MDLSDITGVPESRAWSPSQLGENVFNQGVLSAISLRPSSTWGSLEIAS
jgi:hypothetical protein